VIRFILPHQLKKKSKEKLKKIYVVNNNAEDVDASRIFGIQTQLETNLEEAECDFEQLNLKVEINSRVCWKKKGKRMI